MHQSDIPSRPSLPNESASAAIKGFGRELAQLGSALKTLFGAQWHLLSAELGLARSAISLLMVALVVALVFGVALGLTVMALLAYVLAIWFNSWIWALVALAGLQLIILGACLLVAKKCAGWMTIPQTRREVRSMVHDAVERARRENHSRAPANPS